LRRPDGRRKCPTLRSNRAANFGLSLWFAYRSLGERHSGERHSPPPLRRVLCGTLAINRSSRTEVRFASLSGQSARLKPMLAGICFESIRGILRIRDIPQLKI